jgi:hypothetical protein
VQYIPDASQERRRGGVFAVVRCMPVEQSEQSYRILSENDGHERVARESQLDKLT